LNVSLGAAVQQLKLMGDYAVARDLPFMDSLKVSRSYNNWTPNLSASYQLPRNMWLHVNYSYEVSEPSITDLQSVPNTDNPLYRSVGNPSLKPERNHSISLNFHYWDPASFSSLGIGSNYNLYDENIAYNQTIEVIENLGIRTTTRPDNVKGGSGFSTWLWSSFPVIKTKLTLDMNGSLSFGNSPAYVNNELNETRNRGYNLDLGINLTPSPKLLLYVSQGFNNNNITYSIREEQNQKIRNYETYGSVKWQFAEKFFLESSFNYTIYRNDQFDFSRDIPIWNASFRRILGKKNRFEIRLAAFDILNKRVYISQYGSANYISYTNAPTLARYYMLSATYNLKGFEAKLKKNNYW
jgi:outer membrane receptor protein involved in Fe transport